MRSKTLLVIFGDIEFFEYFETTKENKFVDVIDYLRVNNTECSIMNVKKEK